MEKIIPQKGVQNQKEFMVRQTLNKEVDQYLSFKILSLVRFKECFVKIDTMLNRDWPCP